MPASAQIVDIVFEQLLQTRLRHIHQLDFGLGAGSRSCTTLYDILLARTCRLYHLVYGAIALLQVLLTEVEGHLVDDFCLLVRQQLAVVA